MNAHQTKWSEASPPTWPPRADGTYQTTGRLRSCDWCGSMHPTDLVAALKAGARLDWADWKYGWPHKAYVEKIPNPHAGMLESRTGMSHPPQEEIDAGKWIKVRSGYNPVTGQPQYTYSAAGEPASALTYGKFYSEHLQDATPEERDTIERAMGLRFTFEGGRVSWRALLPSEKNAPADKGSR